MGFIPVVAVGVLWGAVLYLLADVIGRAVASRLQRRRGSRRLGVVRERLSSRLVAAGLPPRDVVLLAACGCLALLGFHCGMFLDNLGLALVLAAGLSLLPFEVLAYLALRHRHNLNLEVMAALKSISGLYGVHGHLARAIAEATPYMGPRMQRLLGQVMAQYKANRSLAAALRDTKPMIDSRHYRAFADLAAQALKQGTDLTAGIEHLVSALDGESSLAEERGIALLQQKLQIYVLVAITLGVTAVMIVGWPDIMSVYITTSAGKAILAVIALVQISGAVLTSALSKV